MHDRFQILEELIAVTSKIRTPKRFRKAKKQLGGPPIKDTAERILVWLSTWGPARHNRPLRLPTQECDNADWVAFFGSSLSVFAAVEVLLESVPELRGLFEIQDNCLRFRSDLPVADRTAIVAFVRNHYTPFFIE